jgi:FkbM family methyltransferase
MELIQKIGRSQLTKPLHKVGLAIGSHWPAPVRTRLGDGRVMFVDLRSGVGRALLIKGEFDSAVFEPFRGALRAGDTFLDVGANVGYYSLLALEIVGDRGSVHAFEIDARPLRCLRRTIRHGGLNNLHVHELALADRCGLIGLACEEDCGHSHVDAREMQNRVAVATLDVWAEFHRPARVQALKIDVEGAELAVLRGAEKFLTQHRPLIVCEAVGELAAKFGGTQEAVVAYLNTLGYRTRFLEGVFSPTIIAEWPR